jgi:twitching motility protein PilT
LEAAETGHLVLSTLHTIDAAKTIDRIIGVFPKAEEAAIRTRLSQSFRRIISQRLMPKVGGGRIAAIEILVSNSRTREYIEKGEKEGRSITDAMNDGALDGMQTFDKVLEKYIRERLITKEIGLAYASNSTNLSLAISDMDEGANSVPFAPVQNTSDGSRDATATAGNVLIEGFER